MLTVPTLNAEQMLEIFKLQLELNPMYDPTWYNTHPVKYLSAAKVEMVEMMEEIETRWKWYQHNPSNRPEKALFELVDVMHFLASYTVLTFRRGGQHVPLDDIAESCNYCDEKFNFCGNYEDSKHHFDMAFMAHMYNLEGEISKAAVIGIKSMGVHLTYMNQLCSGWLRILGYTPEQYMIAHRKKHDLNRERAMGGVTKGNYDKSTERELHI